MSQNDLMDGSLALKVDLGKLLGQSRASTDGLKLKV